jgi:hypothetical protein
MRLSPSLSCPTLRNLTIGGEIARGTVRLGVGQNSGERFEVSGTSPSGFTPPETVLR